jgi:ligand-binding sensor domain-containing protein/signal transduction histidine kinase
MKINAPMRVLFILLVLLAGSACTSARPTEVGFKGFSRTLWEAKDGLPDQTIQALAQTPDGGLWIGTKGGLLRFDGVQFTAYGQGHAPEDLERGVTSLLVTRDGSLWIGTEGGGVIRYHDGRFEHCPTSDGQTNSFIRTIFQDRKGNIWVGSDQGLSRYNGKFLTRIDNTQQVPTIFVRSIIEDPAGHIWVGGTLLLEFDGESLIHEYPLPGPAAAAVITAMMWGHDETLWIGMFSGLYRMGKAGHLNRIPNLSAQISVIAEGKNDTVWLGTVGQGFFYYRDSRFFHVRSSEFPSDTVDAVLDDREGNFWLGTQGGLVRLSPNPVSIIPFPGGGDSEFETLYLDHDQSVWVAASSHLFRIRNGIAWPVELAGLPRVPIRTLLRDRKGDVWVGTGGAGLIHVFHGRTERFDADRGLCNDFVRAILESRDGSIWAGTDGGLTHITRNGSAIYEPASGLAYFSITSLFEDRDGNIWVGTSRGLSRLVNGKIVRDATTAGLARERLWSITQDASGEIWFGTSSGLYGLKAGKLTQITAADGLVSDTVLQILRDGKGNIWLSGPNSISRLREHDLDEFKPGGRIHLTFFEDPQGLESAAFYSGMQPEGAVAANGDVWYPSSKGAVRISVNKIVQAPLSPVLIERVSADGQALPLVKTIKLRPGNSRLEIAYAAIHLGEQGGLRYRYQMDGLEPWIEAGTRRTAYYTHIPAGTYRFRVQVFEIDNPARIDEASILVVQEPQFYATYWFLAICLVSTLSLGFLVYRYRLHQMRLQFRAVNTERMRLAREMHDTVIQGCVGVSTLLEAAQGVEGEDEQLRQHLLGYATEQVRSTIEAARDAVWALRNTAEADSDMGVLSQRLSRGLELDSGIPIRCQVRGAPFNLGRDATHELVMTLKEAITNALSHAEANSISVQVCFLEHELAIDILDDGRGFNSSEVTPADGHFGIIGMTERVKLLGGTLKIDSGPAQGTALHVRIPRHNKGTQGNELRQ